MAGYDVWTAQKSHKKNNTNVYDESYDIHSDADTNSKTSNSSNGGANKFNSSSSTQNPISIRKRRKIHTSFSAMRTRIDMNYIESNDIAHNLISLVGGTDTSKDVTFTFLEAWD